MWPHQNTPLSCLLRQWLSHWNHMDSAQPEPSVAAAPSTLKDTSNNNNNNSKEKTPSPFTQWHKCQFQCELQIFHQKWINWWETVFLVSAELLCRVSSIKKNMEPATHKSHDWGWNTKPFWGESKTNDPSHNSIVTLWNWSKWKWDKRHWGRISRLCSVTWLEDFVINDDFNEH